MIISLKIHDGIQRLNMTDYKVKLFDTVGAVKMELTALQQQGYEYFTIHDQVIDAFKTKGEMDSLLKKKKGAKQLYMAKK